jgi:hypothetical protein
VKLKADDQVHRHVSTTSKSIQKLNVETMEHVRENLGCPLQKPLSVKEFGDENVDT